MKKAVLDFLCAFTIFGIVLVSATLLLNADFFENAVSWNKSSLTLSLFDRYFTFDRRIPNVLNKLLEVNDMFFGKGFSGFIKYAVEFFGNFAEDFLGLSYNFAKDITGVK